MSTGPFIVRLLRSPFPLCANCGKVSVSRGEMTIVSAKAVATLDEARRAAEGELGRAVCGGDAAPGVTVAVTSTDWVLALADVRNLGPEGATIPLPSGESIEVEAVTWTRLASEAGVARTEAQRTYVRHTRLSASERRGILRDWNEKHAVEGVGSDG